MLTCIMHYWLHHKLNLFSSPAKHNDSVQLLHNKRIQCKCQRLKCCNISREKSLTIIENYSRCHLSSNNFLGYPLTWSDMSFGFQDHWPISVYIYLSTWSANFYFFLPETPVCVLHVLKSSHCSSEPSFRHNKTQYIYKQITLHLQTSPTVTRSLSYILVWWMLNTPNNFSLNRNHYKVFFCVDKFSNSLKNSGHSIDELAIFGSILFM